MNLPSLFRRNGSEALRSLTRLQDDFERFFHEISEFEPRMSLEEFSPSCELSEDKNNYVAKFDMPGVKKEDVKIEIDGNRLSVSAERREEKKTDDKRRHYSEISYGSYQRSFTLPVTVDEKKVDAKFDSGVLTLTLPKAATSTAKQIPVQ